MITSWTTQIPQIALAVSRSSSRHDMRRQAAENDKNGNLRDCEWLKEKKNYYRTCPDWRSLPSEFGVPRQFR